MGWAVTIIVAMAAAAPQDKSEVTSLPRGSPPVIMVPAAPPTPEQVSQRSANSQASFPRPINPGGWISQEDYPAAAIRANAEGVVGYRLDVDPNGRPTSCSVLESSGNADLDAAACTLLTRRGRFEPARDARGRAISGSYVSRVRWDLGGRLRPIPNEGEMIITLTAASDGSVTDCRFAAKGAAASAASDPCKTIRFAPQTGPDGKARRIRLTTRVEYLEEE